MAILQTITVKETSEELSALIRNASSTSKPRLKMLLAITQGITSTQELAQGAKVNRDSIRKWKKKYIEGGLTGLLEDKRGGNNPSAITMEQKLQLEKRLSDPKGGFTSYKEAVGWINETFNLKMGYHATNKYIKRHFRVKFKVGRKTHINKDENAAALFKKTTGDPQ
jgi:transposase